MISHALLPKGVKLLLKFCLNTIIRFLFKFSNKIRPECRQSFKENKDF